MTELAARHPRPERRPFSVPAPGPDRGGDVIELVLADHRRIRRLCQALDDAVLWTARSGAGWAPAHIWQRLAELIKVHTLAEEEICYPSASCCGARAAANIRAMVASHDDIREVIAEAALQPAGSALWWRAVRTVQAGISSHLDQEERDTLVGWQRQLTSSRRLELGRQWTAFTAAWTLDTAQAVHEGTRGPRSGGSVGSMR